MRYRFIHMMLQQMVADELKQTSTASATTQQQQLPPASVHHMKFCLFCWLYGHNNVVCILLSRFVVMSYLDHVMTVNACAVFSGNVMAALCWKSERDNHEEMCALY